MKGEALGLVSATPHAPPAHDRIEVAAPRGDFVPAEGSGPVLLVSAGIGVTPLLAMLHRLADETSPREVWWINTTHDAHTHAMAAEAADLLGRLPAAHSLVYYTAPDLPPAPDSGIRIGRLTAPVIADLGLPTDATAYVCGPESYMSDVTAALQEVGIDPREIHTERFGSRSAINRPRAPAPHQPPDRRDRPC